MMTDWEKFCVCILYGIFLSTFLIRRTFFILSNISVFYFILFLFTSSSTFIAVFIVSIRFNSSKWITILCFSLTVAVSLSLCFYRYTLFNAGARLLYFSQFASKDPFCSRVPVLCVGEYYIIIFLFVRSYPSASNGVIFACDAIPSKSREIRRNMFCLYDCVYTAIRYDILNPLLGVKTEDTVEVIKGVWINALSRRHVLRQNCLLCASCVRVRNVQVFIFYLFSVLFWWKRASELARRQMVWRTNILQWQLERND